MELVEAVATAGSSAASRELSEATASDRPSQREAQGRARREGPRQPLKLTYRTCWSGFAESRLRRGRPTRGGSDTLPPRGTTLVLSEVNLKSTLYSGGNTLLFRCLVVMF